MRKLLLVDDDPFSHKMLEDIFRDEWKIRNETAIDQVTAALDSKDVSLVLLNASIRGSNAEEMFDRIQQHSPEVPIISFTQTKDARLGRQLLKKGAFWNLTMPLNTDDLAHAMMMAIKLNDIQDHVMASTRDFTQLETGIARMFSTLKDKFPTKFTFDSDEMIQGIVELLAEILQVEKTSLMLLNHETGELRIKAAKGLTQYVIQNSVRKLGEGIAGWVAQEGKPLLIKDVQKDPTFSESPFYHQYTTKSLICVPLKFGDQVIGVLSANNPTTGAPFDDKDLYLSTIFSHLLLLTLHNAQLHFDRNRMHARDASLLQLNRKVNATLEPKVLYRVLLTECASIFKCELAFLFLLHEKNGEMKVYFLEGKKFSESELPAAEVRSWLSHRSSPVCLDANSDSREVVLLQNLVGHKILSWLSAPVILQDKLAGTVEMASSAPHRFRPEDTEMLVRINQQASLAINNSRLYVKLLDSLKEITEARKEVERVRKDRSL